MSASLVGSEMCIRDRHTADKRTRRGPESTRGLLRATEKHPDISRAVSYTHLTLPTICSV
eukprot:12393850-Alexandrium_andersonii.AAC.1